MDARGFAALFGWSVLATALAAEPPRPATPGEINAGLGLSVYNGAEFSLSHDGRWLGFNTSKGGGYVDLSSGKMHNSRKGWTMSVNSVNSPWSPVETLLAVRVFREYRTRLALWAPDTDTTREILVFPRKLYPTLPPLWSPDGKTLYIVLNQNLPWPRSLAAKDNSPMRSNNVVIEVAGAYKTDTASKRFEREYENAHAESNRCLVLSLDIEHGTIGLLAKGNDIDSLYASPDGRRLAAVQIKRDYDPDLPGVWAKQLLADVYLIDTQPAGGPLKIDLEKFEDRRAGWSDASGARLKPALSDLQLNHTGAFNPPYNQFGTNGNPTLSWSPDSARLVYATVGRRSSGDIFVHDLASGTTRNLTTSISLPFSPKSIGYGENLTHAYDSQKFGGLCNPLWMPDGQSLAALGRGDVWLIPLDPAQSPRKLTEKIAEEIVRIVPSTQSSLAAVDASGRLILIARNRQTRYDSVLKLDPASGDVTRIADTGVYTNLVVRTDRKARHLVYTGQTSTSARNLSRLALDSASLPELVTRYRLQLADRVFPESRVLSWKTPDGYQGYGLLYLPPGRANGEKTPLVLDGYPSQDESRIDVRAQAGASFYNDGIAGLLAEKIAVFRADIPMSDSGVYEKPMKQVVDGVNAAIDAALATGAIDETRLGIMGTSYGGIMVNAVISQTQRFKAAVSISGLSNWYADYMGGGDLSGFYHEYGQGRFVKPLWEEPQRYIENSPITYWNQVRTPLLVVHGDLDRRVPIRHATETFKGLEHQKRTVVFARYARMAHGANPEAGQRIRGWFREHLLGGPAISHLAEQPSFLFGGSEADEAPDAPDVPVPAPTTPQPPPEPRN